MLSSISNSNLDLLSVGVAVAAIGVLGFVIFFNNPKSITNKSFLLFSLITIFWGISNYFEYKFSSIVLALYALRIHLFISVWHAFAFFQLAYVFPKNSLRFPKWYKFLLIPVVILTSILTLTSFVFTKIEYLAPAGEVTNPTRGPGIILFSFLAFGLLVAALIILLIKTVKSKGLERRQTTFILNGMLLTAFLILLFNLILPVTFNNLSFIPLGAVFTFPFIALTAYAIYKHELFNVKVATTALFTVVLAIVTFLEVIFSNNLVEIIFRSSVFLLVLIFSILLLRGVLREVEQRERIQIMAADLGKANQEMEKANEKLKELDQLKSEFVSLATHQIRAPLTAIKGYISMIEEGDYGEVTTPIKEALSVIHTSSDNLLVIVNDFLNVSRIEQGKMKYDFKDFDIQELAQQVVTELKPNVEKKGLKLNYAFEQGKNYMVNADLGKIKQVIGNIIDNSIKYTPVGNINVSVTKPSESKVLVKVSDTGVGIPPKVMPKLFKKFSRADDASDVNILGTGLGLYVAKEMIDAHHGRIWAESKGENMGSQFYIELPTQINL